MTPRDWPSQREDGYRRARMLGWVGWIAVLSIVGLIVVGIASAARAGGSDSATPYTVDSTGITLPTGSTFPDNGHVNIRWDGGSANLHFEGKCITRTDAECAGPRHDAAQYIGRSFIPWSAFGVPTTACITWVQISTFNEHYGEGHQPPVCLTEEPPCTPTPSAPAETPTPTVSTEPSPEPSTASPSPTPTTTPSPQPSPEPSTDPSLEPLPTSSEPPTSPSPTPTVEPSATPTPSVEPTPAPSPSSPVTGPTDPTSAPQTPSPEDYTQGDDDPTDITYTSEVSAVEDELAYTGTSPLGIIYTAVGLLLIGTIAYGARQNGPKL